MLKFGMGWLGWTEEQVYSAKLSNLLLAREGRYDMLQAIFGKKDTDGKQGFQSLEGSGKKATGADIKAFVQEHNIAQRERRADTARRNKPTPRRT